MKYLLYLFLILTLVSCKQNTATPKEISDGLKEYSAILGDFNFIYTTIEETDSKGKKQNLLVVTIIKNTILADADKDMLNAFSSGAAYYIYKNLNQKQIKKFDGITIKFSLDDIESAHRFYMKDLAIVKKFTTKSESYIEFVKDMDIKSMYSAYGPYVTEEISYENFEQMMLSGFEDDYLENVLLVGAGFFQEDPGQVIHLRYVLVFKNEANRRHSIYYYTDDGDTLIDGFQL